MRRKETREEMVTYIGAVLTPRAHSSVLLDESQPPPHYREWYVITSNVFHREREANLVI